MMHPAHSFVEGRYRDGPRELIHNIRRRRACWFVLNHEGDRRRLPWIRETMVGDRKGQGRTDAGRLSLKKGECVYLFEIPICLFDNNIDGPSFYFASAMHALGCGVEC